MTRSPFFVIEDAISPSRCEQLISELGISVPNLDDSGKPIKHEKLLSKELQVEIFQKTFFDNKNEIEERFSAVGTPAETPVFQQFFENPNDPCSLHSCENSKFLRKKWVKVKDVDLVGYIWLKDFNSGVPLDPRFEVYGGKLEFPAYDFSLVPQRGTCVFFPAGPHFITAISPVLIGSLEIIKLTIKLKSNDLHWVYNPSNFPGTYQEWLLSD